MKVQVEISNETLQAIMDGRRVEGAMRMQLASVGTHSEIGFKAYHRQPRKNPHERLILKLEHGWVKESPQRIRVHESIPKDIGATRVCRVLDRETDEAKKAIIYEDLDILEFC